MRKSFIPSLLDKSPSLLYFSFNKESNWIYSTLFVKLVPSFLFILQISPIASFGILGTQIEFISKPNLILEPIADGIQLKDKIFISLSINFLTFPLCNK